MRVNGRSALACQENIGQVLAKCGGSIEPGESAEMTIAPAEMTIAPLGNLPVIKDLVVDMKPFWQGLKNIDPYISTAARQLPEREFLQSPEQRQQLDQTGNCIMCGACYSECNSVTVNPDFVGPHALAKAHRLVTDNRDQDTTGRLQQYGQGEAGVWGCTRCNYCNEVCPMGVAPLDQISKIKGKILAQAQQQPSTDGAAHSSTHSSAQSRAVRHRQQMVALVKQGGWIDERKFGINVVGNQFQDLRGLASLVPLGLRMLRKGKFPTHFQPSEGTAVVRSLIESVQQFEAAAARIPKP